MTKEEETPAAALPPVGGERTAKRALAPNRFAVRLARWAGELLTVFVGVCAAFLFNNYQLHTLARERRGQILAWMEDNCAEQLANAKEERAIMQKHAEVFRRSVEAGEMPPLHAFTWVTDYDPSDVSSMLASGGYDLLEVETVREIKDTEDTLRQFIGTVRHDQQLSDSYLLPNLEKDRTFFYDPTTKQLRPSFEWYGEFYKSILTTYGILQPQLEQLLAQIRAERRRNH